MRLHLRCYLGNGKDLGANIRYENLYSDTAKLNYQAKYWQNPHQKREGKAGSARSTYKVKG